MMNRLALDPRGHLLPQDDAESPDALAADLVEELQEAFDRSTADGLLRLSFPDVPAELPPSLGFWRGFARRLFERLRELGDATEQVWKRLVPPDDMVFERLVASAPPLRGIEYLSVGVLRSLWSQLHARVLERAAEHSQGAEGLSHQLHPHWHTFGRVTFHLAENKRDPQRPFAFLATLAHRVSAAATLQHLPLAEAVKKYAAAGEQDKLKALLQPVQRAAERNDFVRELLQSRALFQPQAWDPEQAYRFLSGLAQMQEAGIVVRLPNWWNPRQPPRPQVQVRIGQKTLGPSTSEILLDFDVSICVDGQPLTAEEKERILACDEGLILLRGKWVEVNREQIGEVLQRWELAKQEHAEGLSFVEGLRILADTAPDGRSTLDQETLDWTQVVSGDWMRETLAKIRDPASVDGCQPGLGLHATLRPYQETGVRWLWLMNQLRLGACLADDMGLGKTIQVIALLLNQRRTRASQAPHRQQKRDALPVNLLIVPASLIGNWKQEFERFAPTLRVVYAHRSEISAEELADLEAQPHRRLQDVDVMLTTYSYARTATWLSQFRWLLVVIDEAQAIKNSGSAQTRAIKRLPSDGRIALTGTPVENSLGDLWSIFDFCCPGLLGAPTDFKKLVKRLSEGDPPRGFAPIRQLVRPYILRRLKTDPSVAPELPEKTEMRVDCGLSKRQAVLYEKTVKEFARQLEQVDGIARRGLVLSVILQLKQICNHPAHFLNDGRFAPEDSGKFERLAQICQTIAERQERMLVFTQFQALTGPLAEFLQPQFGQAGIVLHGGTPVGKRKELVKQFQSAGGPPFFVISLKAGGIGLNLTAASHVVHFDRWWNPAVENQATDRAFRIGQKRNVLVHKFTCRGTVEERIDEMIRSKQKMSDDILTVGDEIPLTEMNDEQLLSLIKLDLKRATSE